jgi:nucleotide-binding universal stress UspA family protein
MIERVVVPVNFTDESEHALLVAPVLANWAGGNVEVISVVEPSNRPDVETRLARLADALGDGTTWRVVESGGPLEPALLTELHRRDNVLWCVGSHARSALGELLLHSVSEELVRDAHMPVALVGPHVVAPPHGRVLAVALDGTPPSEAILPVADELARGLGMTLRLLQVGEAGYWATDTAETAYLAVAASKVPTKASRAVDYDVLHGKHPAHDIVDYVATYPEIGMLAVATRGLTGGARLRHGSTSFELAHRAGIPVVILHHV